MSAAEFRKKSVKDLEAELLDVSKELFNLRMQNAVGQLNRNHLIKQARVKIAQIKTVLTEKSREGN